MLDDLFGTTGHVDAAQECARAALIFAYGLVMVRLGGRRAFARWSALDIVVAIVTGSNLSRALTGSAPLWGTLLATTVLFVLHALLAAGAARSPWLSRWVEGRAAVLARDGVVDRAAMKRHAVSETALSQALQSAGVLDIRETRLVILEPAGHISVLKA